MLLHGQREQALTFEGSGFFYIYIYIYLFSRRRENRASASIDFSYVCSESVAKFLRVSYILAPSQNQPHRSVFRCLWVLLSVLLLRNHNMYFVFVFCTKPSYCRPFSRRTKKKKRKKKDSHSPVLSAQRRTKKPTVLLLCSAFI